MRSCRPVAGLARSEFRSASGCPDRGGSRKRAPAGRGASWWAASASRSRPAHEPLHAKQVPTLARVRADPRVKASSAIRRRPPIENRRLKPGPRCDTLSWPEGSGIQPDGPPRWLPGPSWKQSLASEQPGTSLSQAASRRHDEVSRRARQAVRAARRAFSFRAVSGRRSATAGRGADGFAARIAVLPPRAGGAFQTRRPQ